MDQSKALFIGYCSLPVKLHQSERIKFLNNQIGGLFDRYKKALNENSLAKQDYTDNNLFTPTYYYLWGKYDVCVISDIDDLEFATRFFRPFNPVNPNSNSNYNAALENFDYKVITGINPAESQYFGKKKLPYIGITQLKLNSSFLIGNGYYLISAIKNKIATVIETVLGDNKKTFSSLDIQYKITESFSYHELIIVIHCNSIYSIKNVITQIRNLNVSTLNDSYEKILENSIIHELIGKIDNGKELTNHLFESTHTTFGVHQHVYDYPFKDWSKDIVGRSQGEPFASEDFTFASRWSVKSGHCKMVYDALEKQRSSSNITDVFTTAGRSDIMLLSKISVENKSDSDINPLLHPGNLFIYDENLSYHVVETFTTICFRYKDTENIIDLDTHKDIHDNLKRFQIKQSVIEHAIYGMRVNGVPKILSEKVLKLISNYNNAILNPDMYACFVELYFYITDNLLQTINEYGKNNGIGKFNSRILISKLETGCACLEASFQNRFYQSYWMSEVLEVNIDYSGGVHNLISAYDSCFKELNNSLRPSNRSASFVYVKSDHTVSSFAESLLLNYLHLTQPYIYCVISIYETLNFIVEKWYYSDRNLLNKQNTNDESLIEVLGLLHSVNIQFKGEYISESIKQKVFDVKKLLGPNSEISAVEESLKYSIEYNLIKFINEKTFRYFINDYINYKYVYNEDFNLFCKNTWLYIIQLGNIYESINKMNANAFITVSIRLALVQKYSNSDTTSIFPPELNSLLNDQIDKYKSSIYFLINRLNKNELFNKWFNIWSKEIISKNKYGLIPVFSPSPNLIVVCNEIDKFLLNFENVQIEPIVSSLNDLVSTHKKIVSMQKENDFSYLYYYLIKKYIEFCSKNIKVLIRDSYTGKPKFSAADINVDLFIDPSGGTFVIGEENRKKYLLSRVKFIRLLTHLSSLQKKQYISEILKNNPI